MTDNGTRALLISRLAPRLARLGLGPRDLTDSLDLVRNGVLDSLGFVDLIAELETASGRRVDLERALEGKGATTVGGIINLFQGP